MRTKDTTGKRKIYVDSLDEPVRFTPSQQFDNGYNNTHKDMVPSEGDDSEEYRESYPPIEKIMAYAEKRLTKSKLAILRAYIKAECDIPRAAEAMGCSNQNIAYALPLIFKTLSAGWRIE